MASHQLRRVETPEDWQALHRIRRAVLFAPGRRSMAYDENHPDDRAAGNTPYLLLADGEAVGVARLDQRGTEGIVRSVAVVDDRQGTGLGRVLDELLEAEARRLGITKLRVSANDDAVGFYEKTGWCRATTSRTTTGSVKMEKILI